MRQERQQDPRDVAVKNRLALPTDVSGAVRSVFSILDAWQVTPEQAQRMLGIKRRTYFEWRKSAPPQPDVDKLERISYILGVYKALGILFPIHRDEWIHMPNEAPLFNGAAPLDVMASGQVADLYRVRAWLDGWRGWN